MEYYNEIINLLNEIENKRSYSDINLNLNILFQLMNHKCNYIEYNEMAKYYNIPTDLMYNIVNLRNELIHPDFDDKININNYSNVTNTSLRIIKNYINRIKRYQIKDNGVRITKKGV